MAKLSVKLYKIASLFLDSYIDKQAIKVLSGRKPLK